MKRSLVLGANGFLGSHLVDLLASRGHRVTAYDRFRSRPPAFRRDDIAVIRGDVSDASALESAMAHQDLVFHFAGSTVPSPEDDPLLEIRQTVEPAARILQCAARMDVERVVFASSGGAIYGDAGVGLVSETTVPRPVNSYAIGKATVEHLLRRWRRETGASTIALRFGNPFGPGQRADKPQGLIPIALRSVRRGQPVTVYGDGSMIRDYIYVEDAVRMTVDLAELPAPQFEEYNIGSGRGHSVAEVLAAVEQETGIPLERIRREVPRGFVERVVLDTARVSAEIEIGATATLADGIRRTWSSIDD